MTYGNYYVGINDKLLKKQYNIYIFYQILKKLPVPYRYNIPINYI